MNVTRRDISLKTGVSSSTVAMILNGRGEKYAEETRRKVTEAAKEMNYRPHISARALRMKRSFLVGLSVFRSNSLVMIELMRGVQDVLQRGDYSALVLTHSSHEEELKCHRQCAERHVDGMIVNPALAEDGSIELKDAYLDASGRNVPMVEILGRALAEAPGVNIDDIAGGRNAVEHLLSLGHRRIAMLTHDRYRIASATSYGRHSDAWHRYQGYSQAMEVAGLEPLVITHPIHGEFEAVKEFYNGGLGALDGILNHPAHPTAVVCYSDVQVYGLMRAAELIHVKIPQQLSIVGNGDLELFAPANPGVTTIATPAYEMGQRAAESLLALIEKQPVEDVLLEPKLVVRGSTCAANGEE